MVTIAGLCLIIGAYFTYTGRIFYSVMSYFIADLIWIYLAFLVGDIQGAIFVIIGTILGMGAFIKMKTGKMKKDLNW